ncbi:c-type cytochrome [Paraburkholderia sp. GAS334]|uniref:c-type cytochrome n=1 Tax=Paraburkholderia sp. GAS334 TaxID=3035131 RepID=UPI003D1DD1BD
MRHIQIMPIALAACLSLATVTARSQDEIALGKTLTTNNCAVCHTFGQGEPNGQGPNLFGIIGRPFAAVPGFKYSAEMKAAAAGRVWDDRLLDQWLTDTQAVAPGNAMTYFEGDEARRTKIIAYLRTLH